MSWRKPSQASADGLARIVIYLVAIARPPVLASTLEHGRHVGHRFIPQLANNVGLVGYTLLAFQFVLAARLKWVEQPFGLDMVFAFHKAMNTYRTIRPVRKSYDPRPVPAPQCGRCRARVTCCRCRRVPAALRL
jgi:hypothetical protein